MTIHRPHPIQGAWNGAEYNDSDTALLYDDCPRCKELVNNLGSLDDNKFKLLWKKMIRVEYDNEVDYYDSITEARVCYRLFEIAGLLQRHFGIKAKEVSLLKTQITTMQMHGNY